MMCVCMYVLCINVRGTWVVCVCIHASGGRGVCVCILVLLVFLSLFFIYFLFCEGHRNSPVSCVRFTGNSFVVTNRKTKKTETHENATQADWNAFLKTKSKSRFMATLIERIKNRRSVPAPGKYIFTFFHECFVIFIFLFTVQYALLYVVVPVVADPAPVPQVEVQPAPALTVAILPVSTGSAPVIPGMFFYVVSFILCRVYIFFFLLVSHPLEHFFFCINMLFLFGVLFILR